MSYHTVDRFGNYTVTYAHARGGGPPGGVGLRNWWPDFGPGCQDFSQQRRSHPSEGIFESVVEPKKWSHEARSSQPMGPPMAEQFRNPAPARHAMLHKSEPDVERKLAAHMTTNKAEAIRRLELRSK